MSTSHLKIILIMCLIHSAVTNALPVSNQTQITDHFRLALDAIFGIGIRLQAFLKDDADENFLVSPISATVIIGQLLLGAEGEFRQQLVQLLELPNSHLYENDKYYIRDTNLSYSLPYSTLHFQLSSLLKSMESSSSIAKQFTLKEKSAVFVDDQIELKSEFKKYLEYFYLTEIKQLNFARKPVKSLKIINNWASRQTNGLIRQILSEPPSRSTASVFLNAIYFLAEWETPFSNILNREGQFQVSPDKQVNVTYMTGFIEQIPYVESEDYRMITLPYKGNELGMYLILPKSGSQYEYDIKGFTQNLKAVELLSSISKMQLRDVTVKLPKMTLAHTFSILEQLKKYRAYKKQEKEVLVGDRKIDGINTLENKVQDFNNFTTDIDRDLYLTNAAVNKKLRINDIIQQVSVTINEKGTEAAAVSATTIDYIGGSKNFIINRPFVFFIRHEATSATLFWATIGNPNS